MRRIPRPIRGTYAGRVLLVLTCLALMSGCMALLPKPKITHHFDNFVAMETHDRDSLTSKWGMIKICREFYRHYEDEFDVLVLVYQTSGGFEDLHWGPYIRGRMAVVRNTETGTGTRVRDIGKTFWSESRLKGVVQLASAKRIIDGSLLHELMHLWVSNVAVIPSSNGGHWGFSSVGGRLGGFQRDELRFLGEGKFSAGKFLPYNADKSVPYSALEMYLAGLIPASDVPDVGVAEDGGWSKKDLTESELADCEIEDGPFAGDLDLDCTTELDSDGNRVFIASKISTWNIDQIIKKLGPRVPNFENSQKEFRVAFVLVSNGDAPVTEMDFKISESIIEDFSAKSPLPNPLIVRLDGSSRYELLVTDPSGLKPLNFWEATRGIATLQTNGLQSFRR